MFLLELLAEHISSAQGFSQRIEMEPHWLAPELFPTTWPIDLALHCTWPQKHEPILGGVLLSMLVLSQLS